MTACFMLAGTVDDSYDMLMISMRIGVKINVLAFRIAEGCGSSLDVLILLF